MADSTKQEGADIGVPITVMTAKADTGSSDMVALPVGQPGYQRQVSWEKIFPGAAPAAIVINLELCEDDPTVAANWYQVDTDNTLVNTRKNVDAGAARWARLKITTNTTPGGGTTGRITVA